MQCKRLHAAMRTRRCASHYSDVLGLGKSVNMFIYWFTHGLVVLPSVVLTVGNGFNR
jgi:hypothetical protein